MSQPRSGSAALGLSSLVLPMLCDSTCTGGPSDSLSPLPKDTSSVFAHLGPPGAAHTAGAGAGVWPAGTSVHIC